MNREEFEAWYISKFLNVMGNAQAAVIELRNDFGGYDDLHMDGAWECWKKSEQGVDIQCHVKVSAAQAFVFIVLMMAVTGLLYWVCFSGEFYAFVMSLCESCR